MKIYFIFLFGAILIINSFTVFSQNTDSLVIRKIHNKALENPVAYRQLGYLCKNFSGRLCGSEQANKAVAWIESVLMERMFTVLLP
jgi:hypothetical protein